MVSGGSESVCSMVPNLPSLPRRAIRSADFKSDHRLARGCTAIGTGQIFLAKIVVESHFHF
jgi:hypothetical protein